MPSILSKVRLFKGDKVLGVIIPILVVISALVVYSSVAKMGYAHMGTQTNAIFTKHLIVISIAMLTMVGFYFIPAKFLYRIAPYAYAACWFFTLGVYFFGADTNGAARWYDFGFSLQPSELLKVATILLIAANLDKEQQTINNRDLSQHLTRGSGVKKKKKNSSKS